MNTWIDFFYFFITGASLLLSIIGLGFTKILPGIDRWSKHFFRCYFFVLLVGSLSGLIEMIFHYYPAPISVIYIVLFFESLLMSLPQLMITLYLLHCCGEKMRGNRMLYVVLGLTAVYLILLTCVPFVNVFSYITPDMQYYRGPLYPLIPLPIIAIVLINFIYVIRWRERLSRKTFLSFLIAILPLTVTLFVQLFIDVFPLIDICIIISALSMYGLIVSDQIEQDRLYRQEIARQRASVMVLQMRPHFIYNTMMSIYSLINLNPQKARQVTSDFTDYLRKNFNAVTSENPVPFSTELEHTRAYLAVEQAQHEEMLIVEYDTQYTQFRLPPLTLQPIAENAVKHGMDPYAGPLKIRIRTYHENSASVIIVEDNGSGFKTTGDNASGIDGLNTSEDNASESYSALTNIRQRLKLMCDGNLEIAPRDGGGTVVTITIPDRYSS